MYSKALLSVEVESMNLLRLSSGSLWLLKHNNLIAIRLNFSIAI